MESQLLSMTFIMFGMLSFAAYMILYTPTSTFSKWMVGINAVAGFVLLSSYLVGTFQQYSQYLAFLKAQEEMKEVKPKGEVAYVN